MAGKEEMLAKAQAILNGIAEVRQDITDIKNSLPSEGSMSAADVAEVSAKLDEVVSTITSLAAENPPQPPL